MPALSSFLRSRRLPVSLVCSAPLLLGGNPWQQLVAAQIAEATCSTTGDCLLHGARNMADHKPKPQVFAIMRNGHEVIRGGAKDLKVLIMEKEDLESSKEAWQKLKRWTDMHKTMEEGDGQNKGFFKVLDENCEGEPISNFHFHDPLEPKEEELQKAFDAGDLSTVKEAFEEFHEVNEKHLKDEEDIMMPRVMQMAKAGKPMKQFAKEDVLSTVASKEDMEFFIKYANVMLEKHHGNQPRARVFDHALWAVATPEEWVEWDGWIKETLSEYTYQDLEASI